MKKKLLSLVLALGLCLPCAAFAAESKTYYCSSGYLTDAQDSFSNFELSGANLVNREGEGSTAYIPFPNDGEAWEGIGMEVPVIYADGPVTLRFTKGTEAGEPVDHTNANWLNVNTMAYNASAGRYDVQKYNSPVFNGQAVPVTGFDDEGAATGTESPITIQEMFDRWDNAANDFYAIFSGASVTLSEPGAYCVELGYGDLAGLEQFLVIVSGDAPVQSTEPEPVPSATVPETTAAPGAAAAVPTSSPILVNGKNVAFDAYSINGNNYFKLRDLASVLNGTEKQFEVSFDRNANAISLTSGKSYTAMGGEMTAGTAGQQTATPTSSKVLLDGNEVSFEAYTINGNNYFKLRDVGKTFNFGIGWDTASKTITIDTAAAYTE